MTFQMEIKISIEKSCYMIFEKILKSLIGSILDHSFLCLNSFSETNIKKIQVIQSSAVQIDFLSWVRDMSGLRTGLSHFVQLVVRLVEEYREGFESRYIENSTRFFNCYLEH
ncbi:hypothetical protein BpHYR1_018180 [Brachionus plicatilis]|uniref:Uncharacterized protein n=1 Tax=Brachionus plicatilis TaxID=10195 RepID=A0A3M7R4K9_BRAPC|nr:hypothetical protein BpHYR1_018180 [Brachionus plicatilis]